MTYTWGSVEVPELEYHLRPGGPERREHPAPSIVHLPTGLGMDVATDAQIDRGQWQEWMLFPPPGETWFARAILFQTSPGITYRIPEYFGLTPKEFANRSIEEMLSLTAEYYRAVGQTYTCGALTPEPGSPPVIWTAERRDAVVLMLCWIVEAPEIRRTFDPMPSCITFVPKGVPEEFHGTFRNPIWERSR